MKLLFDENLSPRLPVLLADMYPESSHVSLCGLGSADDDQVWQYAKQFQFTIVSKDSDFQERSVIFGAPPKFIWLRTANCKSDAVENLLRTARPIVLAFLEDDSQSCLILGSR